MASSHKRQLGLREFGVAISRIVNQYTLSPPSGQDDEAVVKQFLKMQEITHIVKPDIMLITKLSDPLPLLYEKNFSLDLGTPNTNYADIYNYVDQNTLEISDLVNTMLVEFSFKHKLEPYDFVYRFYFDIDCPNPAVKRLCRNVIFIATDAAGYCSHAVVYMTNVTDQIARIKHPGYDIAFTPSIIHLQQQLMESIAKTLPAPHNLTQRECDIISMLGEGLSSKMIADRLKISKHTVDTHRRNILRKLNAGNTAGILEEAQKLRII